MSLQYSRSASATGSLLDLCERHEGLKMRARASSGDLFGLAAGRPCDESLTAKAKRGGGGGSGGRSSPRSLLPVVARCSWRRVLSAMLALVLCVVLLLKHRQLYRNGQDAVAGLYYGLDPVLLGRSEARFPAPHCCRDEACLAGSSPPVISNTSNTSTSASTHSSTGRVAVVTYLRGDGYAPLLQQLECTLRRSNPGLELGLMMVEGELGQSTLQLAAALNITLLPVPPLDYRNTYSSRYGRNWLKVRALGLTQYDAVLLVDSDVAVVGPLGHLFELPVEFAAVWDQSKWLNRYRTVVQQINGGVFLLRPCAAVERHMLQLLEAHPKLRFTHGTAEQQFFGWYYRYTGATLPLQYNCQVEQSLGEDGLTVGGMAPRVVHFTRNKPFHGPQPGQLGHQFLCSLQELNRRAIMAGQVGPPRTAGAAGEGADAGGAAGAAGEHAQQQAAQEQQQRQQSAHATAAQAASRPQQERHAEAAASPGPAAADRRHP